MNYSNQASFSGLPEEFLLWNEGSAVLDDDDVFQGVTWLPEDQGAGDVDGLEVDQCGVVDLQLERLLFGKLGVQFLIKFYQINSVLMERELITYH